MDLSQYLRVAISNKIRPIFIKDHCEICDSNQELHLHHVKLFRDIVNQTLGYLKLPYSDTTEFSEIDLNMVTNIVLGEHLQIEYLTLCNTCHKSTHKHDWRTICANNKHQEFYELQKQKKELERELYINKVLVPYISNIANTKLFKQEREELINKLQLKVNGKILKGIGSINNFIENNIRYEIVSKREYRTRKEKVTYWKIQLLHE